MKNTPLRHIVILLVIANCLFTPIYAQFTVVQDFKGDVLPSNIILGGSPNAAYLTAGIDDLANDGWLRLTNGDTYQKGFAFINSTFPSTLGILIDFQYTTWRTVPGDPGADGIGVFFFDATSSFALGGWGGSLGYAPNTSAGTSGLAGGYIGIGLDEYGNFSNPTEGRVGGPGQRCNSITLRGATTSNPSTTNPYLTSFQLQTDQNSNVNSIDYNTPTATRPTDMQFYRRVRISIIPIGTTMFPKFRITATWKLTPGGADVPLFTYNTNIPPPSLLKLGFAASTGGSYNYHEIRNLVVTTPGGFRVDKSVDKINTSVSNTLTYTINVHNATIGPASNLRVSDVLKNGLGNAVDISPSGDFNITSITFNNNGNTNNTATGFSNGVPITTGLSNPFTSTLKMDGNTISTFTVVGTVKKLPAGAGLLTNTVTVDPSLTGITDDDLTNNEFSVTSYVLNADFVMKNTLNQSCSDPTGGNTYTLLVSNEGTINSTAGKTVTVTDNIPASFTITGVTAPGWTVTHTGNNYTFKRIDALAFGASYPPILINVNPPTTTGTTWVNTATVAYTGIEATTTNNNSSVTMNASPAAPVVTTPVYYCQGAVSIALSATGTNLMWYTTLGGPGSTTAPIPNTATPGTKTYYVTQNDGTCESKPSAIVFTINPLPTASISGTTAVCQNASSAPDITFTGSGGTAPYTFSYTVNGGSPQTVTTTSGNSVTVSQSTATSGSFVYSLVSVKDASSSACTNAQSGTSTITVNPLPTATIIGTTAVCQNDVSPKVTFTGAGGTFPYTFTYTVNSGASQTVTTTSGNSVDVSQVTTTPGSFVYNLVGVKDASSTACSNNQTGTSTITVNPLPTATISGTATVCQNAVSPVITFTGSGGIAPYTFSYTVNGGVTQTITTTSGTSVTVPQATTASGSFLYRLVGVKDASSSACSNPQSGTSTITVNPLPLASISGSTTVCQNDPSPKVTFTGSGGTAPYTFTYTVNGGANQTVSTALGNSVVVSQVTTTSGNFIYNLVGVSDASGSGCPNTQTGASTITVNPLPTATISGTTTVCQNAASPNITFTGIGGASPYTFTYTINGGANQTVNTTSGNSVTVAVPTTSSGTFVYDLKSVSGSSAACFNPQMGNSTVTINSLPTATISGTAAVCQNGSSAPDITFMGTDGTAPYTFTYTVNGGSPQTVTTTSGNSVTVSQSTAASGSFVYSLVSVKDASSSACFNPQSGTSTITVNPLPTATIIGTTAVCQNDVSPKVTFTGAGGISPYTFTYTVNGGASQTVTTISGNSVDVSQVTTTPGSFVYSLVSVKDASSTACSNNQTGSSTVTVNPLPTGTISGTATVCQNAVSPVITFTGSVGTAPYTFTYTVNGGATQTVTTTSGTSVTVSQVTTASGSFVYSLASVKDVSSSACSNPQSGTSTITVNPLPLASISGSTTVCQNEPSPKVTFTGSGGTAPYTFTYTVNGGTSQTVSTTLSNSVDVSQVTTTSGSFVYSLKSVSDASSTACSNPQTGSAVVTVNKPSVSTTIGSICQGYNYMFNGTAYNATGVYTKHLINKVGCDSVVTLVLTMKVPTTSNANVTICQGDSYLFNGTTYSSTGVYTKHLINKQGCDSTATLNLTVKLPSSSTTNISICQGDSYVFNGTTYTTAGIYTKHFINAVGCDSTAILNLRIKLPTTSTTTASICLGDSYTFNGVSYSTTGTYSNHFINSVGCDSTAILKLTVNLPTTSTTTTSICLGDSYMFCRVAYTTAGTYIGHALNKFGCDSTATLHLSVKLLTSSTTNASICQGNSYAFNGNTYSSAGTYVAHLLNKQGCDSTATLSLTVKNLSYSTTNAEICLGGSYRFNGTTYSTAGTYRKTLINSVGCDSIATLVLKVNMPTSSTTSLIVSATRLPLVWNKNTYYESGVHTSPMHFVNAAGCDSTATLILTVKMPTSSTIKAAICDGDSYYFNGVNYSTAGVYSAHLLDAVGVDSTAILNLTVNPVFTTHNNIILISGDSYPINVHSYDQTGVYTDVLRTTNGCDSTVVSHITVVNIPNTITPNGDGYNDLFMKGWHIKVYNRNGIVLYEGKEGWNGSYHNKPVSKDTYFYVLYYTSESGVGTKAKEGYLMVIP